MSVENHIIKVSFCFKFQKAVKSKRPIYWQPFKLYAVKKKKKKKKKNTKTGSYYV